MTMALRHRHSSPKKTERTKRTPKTDPSYMVPIFVSPVGSAKGGRESRDVSAAVTVTVIITQVSLP